MKTKIRFLLMLSLALILAQTATAATITVDNLTYETSEDGTAAVSGYEVAPTDELEIPATVDFDGTTYNVTSIIDGEAKESGVFYNCTGITSVKLSEGLTSIAKYAFYGCNGMISVNIPESVKIINVNAFLGCRKLASIDLPSNLVTIGNYAFNNCVLLTTVDIPASVTSIGANAFKGCSALASVYFNWTDESKIVSPSTDVFTNISASAILYVPTDCTSYYQDWATYFTSVDEFTTEPDEDTPSTEPTETILTYNITDADAKTAEVTGYDADGVIPTVELVIPATVEIEGETYNVTSIANGTSATVSPFVSCTGITSVVLPESITSIGDFAFNKCSNLKSINLPSGVTALGKFAFGTCGFESIEIPSSVTSIGNNVFNGCSSLSEVYVYWTESPTTVNAGMFTNIVSPATLYIPAGTTSVYEASTWSSISVFTLIEVGDTTEPDEDTPSTEPTETILTYDITDADAKTAEVKGYDLTGLVPTGELVIPATVEIEGITYDVTSIADGNGTDAPFLNCTGITAINLPEGLISIGTYAFRGCIGFTSLEIPSSVTTIGNYAFAFCEGLKSIVLTDGLTTIGNYAFRKCAFESLKIPSSVTSIGNNAFIECTSITSVYFYWYQESSVVKAGTTPFDSSISTSSTLYVPTGCISYYEDKGWSTYFSSVVEFEIILPDNLNYNFDEETKTATVTGYKTTPEGELVIPATAYDENGTEYAVTSIAEGTSTDAPFCNCTGITSIVFPEGLITIGTYAFRGCTGITSLDIASSVTTIGNFAFAYCTNLESINIASSVTSFGNNIFSNCTKISKVYVHWTDTPSSINTGIFGGICNDDKTEINATLYIPAGTKSVYEADSVWSLFTSILEDEDSKEVRVNSTETLRLTGGEEYELITIAEGGEVYAEGLKDITVEKLEIIKTFTYTDGKENNEEWFNLGLPFEVTAGTGSVLKLVNGVYEEAVQGVDYATYDYNGVRRLANRADDGNWDMYVDDSGLIGEAIQFVTNGTHTYKFIAADQDAATTALTAGREGNRFCDADNTSDDNGWNVIPAGKTYTGTYSIEDVLIIQVLNSNGLFASNDDCKFAPGTVFAVKLSSSEANTSVTTSDDESAEITVEKYKFELVDADGVVLDRIFIFDGSDKQQYRVGKMSALSDDKTEMSIQANDKSYCAYSTLASETDKSYTVAISNATEGAQLIMTKAGTQSVTLDDTAVALDSPMAVEDGQITITIGSKVSSVTDATASAKVYAANGSIIIEGAGAYVVTNMSGIIVANGVADSKTAINVASGAYIVNVAGEISKVIVK